LRAEPIFRAAAAVTIVMAFWHLASAALRTYFLPGPLDVVPCLLALLGEPSTWGHIASSAARVAVGLALGSVVGLAMGVAPRYLPGAGFILEDVVYPVLESVPTICWALIFAVLFGLAGTVPTLAVAVAVAPFFAVNAWEGVKELDEPLIEMAHSFTRSRARVLRFVVLPMLYPYLFSALRSSLQVSWKVVVLGEVFGAVDGIGYMIWTAFSSFNAPLMLSWVLISALIIVLSEFVVFKYLDRRFMRRWRR
jgi:ABC-type nitrate/sulfonate/bicarbonate transport system permease component